MNDTAKFLLSLVERAKSGDLERAQRAFAGLSPEKMQEKYGQSDWTRREILDGYVKGRRKWQAAKDLLLELLAGVNEGEVNGHVLA